MIDQRNLTRQAALSSLATVNFSSCTLPKGKGSMQKSVGERGRPCINAKGLSFVRAITCGGIRPPIGEQRTSCVIGPAYSNNSDPSKPSVETKRSPAVRNIIVSRCWALILRVSD